MLGINGRIIVSSEVKEEPVFKRNCRGKVKESYHKVSQAITFPPETINKITGNLSPDLKASFWEIAIEQIQLGIKNNELDDIKYINK